MISQEILSIVRDVLENRSSSYYVELADERDGFAIIGISSSIVLGALIEIAERTGDKYLLVDANPDGGPGIALYIECNVR